MLSQPVVSDNPELSRDFTHTPLKAEVVVKGGHTPLKAEVVVKGGHKMNLNVMYVTQCAWEMWCFSRRVEPQPVQIVLVNERASDDDWPLRIFGIHASL
jgi:hypothetical protein